MIDWFRSLLSNSEDASSKRVAGLLVIGVCLVTFILASLDIIESDVWSAIESSYKFTLTVGAGLLLGTIADNLIDKLKEK